ncbi:hypothetical protein KHAB170019_11060 [Acinetobacter baumannii]|uniref:hypothetical protein n=1 Tax=Acinetobacter baumannii TaxID=470 RepID=UPI00194F6A5E|nr:hypothetical protein [Acinetobacter baumannii]BCR40283.1 hypothetical protein KHAB170019_11060 [Acinetobacter baumannii]
MDNSKRPINQIIARINDAAKHGEALAASTVKILSKDIGDKVFIPVLTNEQVVQLVKEGKLGQKINNTKD